MTAHEAPTLAKQRNVRFAHAVGSPYRAPSKKPAITSPPAADPLGRRLNEATPKARSLAYWFGVWGVGISACLLFGGLAIAVPEARVVFLVLLGVVTLGVVVLAWPDRGSPVALHENGIVAGAQTMLWSDVRWLYRDVSMVVGAAKIFHHGRLHRLVGDHGANPQACVVGYRLVSEDDQTITIPAGLLEPERCDWLEQRASTSLISDARVAFRKGEPFTFDELSIDRVGLSFDGKELQWKDVRDIQMMPTMIRIRAQRDIAPWATLPIERIPHPAVLLALLRERTKVLVWTSGPMPEPSG